MERLAVYEDEWLALYVILVFVAFISGMFLGVRQSLETDAKNASHGTRGLSPLKELPQL